MDIGFLIQNATDSNNKLQKIADIIKAIQPPKDIENVKSMLKDGFFEDNTNIAYYTGVEQGNAELAEQIRNILR